MKNSTLVISMVAASLATALQVSAQIPTPFTSTDGGTQFQDTASSATLITPRLSSGSRTLTGEFDLETDTGSIKIDSQYVGQGANTIYNDETGFNPLTEQAVSGTFSLWIRDTDDQVASYSVNLTGVSGTFPGDPGAQGDPAQYNFTLGTLTTGTLTLLNENGVLTYTITDTGKGDSSDFTVDDLVLQVDATALPNDPNIVVPDGGTTAALLGGALLGLQAFRRKLNC